jgi:hypothetical protein
MHMTRQTFEELGEGLVRVTNPDGKTGVFTWQGQWIEGDVRDVSVHMLIYTGGPDVERGFEFRWTQMPEDINRPSGWPAPQEHKLKSMKLL